MMLEAYLLRHLLPLTSTLLTLIFSFTALRIAANALWFYEFSRFTMGADAGR